MSAVERLEELLTDLIRRRESVFELHGMAKLHEADRLSAKATGLQIACELTEAQLKAARAEAQ